MNISLIYLASSCVASGLRAISLAARNHRDDNNDDHCFSRYTSNLRLLTRSARPLLPTNNAHSCAQMVYRAGGHQYCSRQCLEHRLHGERIPTAQDYLDQGKRRTGGHRCDGRHFRPRQWQSVVPVDHWQRQQAAAARSSDQAAGSNGRQRAWPLLSPSLGRMGKSKQAHLPALSLLHLFNQQINSVNICQAVI